ncbi:hypothetical protein HO133_003202 [Letharia lupina]|uniref:High affinity methionine permease n=1 Tax=Letharia lupina TaxID=560253 RepID=A0A8H6F9M2_9LECA|nr:uncharacterized protein HO133_003202 [Letharia lupina]KAF6220071.1 hypothetical protein HO133_003202 [Letharia lupina]
MVLWRKGLTLGLSSDEKSPVVGSSSDDATSADVQRLEFDARRTPQPGDLTLEQDTAGGLGRHLGLFSTTFLIIGRIIGTGIFSTPATITSSVGSVGAALMLWVLGLLLSFAGLCVWLELGCMFPRSGGEKVYLEAAYRQPRFLATVVFSTQAIFLGFTASGCIIFAENILIAANHNVTEWGERGIALAVIIAVTCIHTFTPNLGVKLMNILGVIKIVVLVFIVITGWVVLGGKVHKIPDPGASFRNSFAGSSSSGYEYATALFKVLNSYAGWSNAAYVLNEVRRPVRTLKVAGPLGLGICGVLYLLANVAFFAAATPGEISSSGNTVATYFFGRVFGAAAERALSVLVALSAFGNVLTVTFIVIVAIPFGDAYDFILDLEGYPSSVIYVFVGIGLFILRWRSPQVPRPFKAWWPVPVFFLLGQGFLLVAPFLRPPGGKGDTSLPYWLYPVVGIAVLACGVLYWFGWRVLLPRAGRFDYAERQMTLKDGTVLTVFDRKS